MLRASSDDLPDDRREQVAAAIYPPLTPPGGGGLLKVLRAWALAPAVRGALARWLAWASRAPHSTPARPEGTRLP